MSIWQSGQSKKWHPDQHFKVLVAKGVFYLIRILQHHNFTDPPRRIPTSLMLASLHFEKSALFCSWNSFMEMAWGKSPGLRELSMLATRLWVDSMTRQNMPFIAFVISFLILFASIDDVYMIYIYIYMTVYTCETAQPPSLFHILWVKI